MKTQLATHDEIEADEVLADSLIAALTDHKNRSFATVHSGLTAVATTYNDSSGALVADKVLVVVIDGTTVYIPCRVVIGESPTN